MSEIQENVFYCTECEKKFKFLKTLRAHIKKAHTLIDAYQIAPTKKLKNNDLYVFTCDQCDKSYCHQKNLQEHKKIAHAEKKTQWNTTLVKCNMCSFTAVHKSMTNHYLTAHNIIENEKIVFENVEDFEIWKHGIEQKTNTCYIKSCGSTKNVNGHTYIYYKCHRNGYHMSKSTGQRHIKTQGSNKINGYCPASMNVIMSEPTNKCTVTFISTHIGHENDLGHLPLDKLTRSNIASKISEHIPFEHILDEIRDNISNNTLERTHLLTKKDLYNIESSYNLNNEAVRHKNDALSVETWVQNLKSDEKFSLVYYKPQDEIDRQYLNLQKEDFLLIIMNNYQLTMLKKFGNDVICIDETHGMNSYHFNLTTILVLDDMREGFPCAFMISNRIDEAVLTIFFSQIKDLTGQIEPKVFMSDMAESFFNAWLAEMKQPKHRLYCTWHVDRAWRKNLIKIKSKEKQTEVYKILRTLLHEQDIKAFEIMFGSAISQMSADNETSDFANYFVSHYGNCVQSWAYCHRVHAGVNTNMHIERMHRTLKHIYLQGKKVKRLDKSLHALMKFIRDKSIDRLVVLHKGKITSKIKELRKRHRYSLIMSHNMVIKDTEDSWNIMSEKSNEMYTVNKLKTACDCQIKCVECLSCIHCYTCSCIDSAIKWNMCKHIHLVCQVNQDISIRNKDTKISSSTLTPIDNLFTSTQENEILPLTNDETANIVSQLNNHNILTNQTCLQSEKENLRLKFENVLDNISSIKELNVLKKCFSTVEPTLISLRKHSVQPTFKKMTSQISPTKKKIIPQRRFYSTKKQRKIKEGFNLEVPSRSEENNISVSLILKNNND